MLQKYSIQLKKVVNGNVPKSFQKKKKNQEKKWQSND